MSVEILQGDSLEVLRGLPSSSVHCCVTSPPYWGLRDYGTATWEGGDAECDHSTPRSRGDDIRSGDKQGTSAGSRPNTQRECHCGAQRIDSQLGLEPTPEEYITRMVAVFREVRRVMRADGTCWVNMGDSYASAFACDRRSVIGSGSPDSDCTRPNRLVGGLKEKDLCGIPWMLAFALRADGWYLRSDIIWAKPNPMPESVTDRPTKSHEYLFLLSKSQTYYYDAEAIKESSVSNDPRKPYAPGQVDNRGNGHDRGGGNLRSEESDPSSRNKRTVWTVATQPTPDAHFATFPEELIKPCILAGCPAGGTVLDPFFGSGTTGLVARANGCNAIGIELNPAYIEIARKKLSQEVFEFG